MHHRKNLWVIWVYRLMKIIINDMFSNTKYVNYIPDKYQDNILYYISIDKYHVHIVNNKILYTSKCNCGNSVKISTYHDNVYLYNIFMLQFFLGLLHDVDNDIYAFSKYLLDLCYKHRKISEIDYLILTNNTEKVATYLSKNKIKIYDPFDKISSMEMWNIVADKSIINFPSLCFFYNLWFYEPNNFDEFINVLTEILPRSNAEQTALLYFILNVLSLYPQKTKNINKLISYINQGMAIDIIKNFTNIYDFEQEPLIKNIMLEVFKKLKL